MLDLSQKSKNFLTVVLPDQTKVFVTSPTKRQVSALIEVQKSPSLESLYSITGELLSKNLQGRIFTIEELEEWSIEDVRSFFAAYMQFVTGIQTDPN